jgi:hypothetical protein
MQAIRSTTPASRQSGAVLFVAKMMLLLAGLLTLFALKVGVFEQRSTGNDVRERAVTEVAEAGLAQGFEYLMRQHAELLADPGHWERCDAGDETFPCGAISAATFDHDGDPATAEVSRRGTMYRLKADDTHVIAGIDLELSKFMLPLSAKIGAVPNGWNAAYGVAPVLCFAEHAENPGAGGIPCGSGSGGPGGTSVSIATFVSVAKLVDEGASKTLVQTVGQYPKLTDDLLTMPPITASGSAGVTGTLQVVTNPNAGGPGVPVSVWSRVDVDKTGTTNTCYADEFFRYTPGGATPTLYQGTIRCDECRCDAKGAPPTLSYDSSGNVQVEGIDVLDVDAGTDSTTGYHQGGHVGVNFNVRADAQSHAAGICEFPRDMFEYVFGTAAWQDTDADCFAETKLGPVVYQNPDNPAASALVGPDEAYLYKNADKIIPKVANAPLLKAGQAGTTALLSSAASSGMIWCQRQSPGDCDIRSNVQVGTPSAPVILILDGPVSIQGKVFGFVFIRDTGNALDPTTGSSLPGGCPNNCILQMNAGAAVYGALVLQGQMKSNGTSAVIYDAHVLRAVIEQAGPVYATLPGAWSDRRSY